MTTKILVMIIIDDALMVLLPDWHCEPMIIDDVRTLYWKHCWPIEAVIIDDDIALLYYWYWCYYY